MPEEDEAEDLAALMEEHTLLTERLRSLADQRDELLTAQARARTQEAVAQRLGISRDELRKRERIALLKAHRAFLKLLGTQP